jgi:hypothetical protein
MASLSGVHRCFCHVANVPNKTLADLGFHISQRSTALGVVVVYVNNEADACQS